MISVQNICLECGMPNEPHETICAYCCAVIPLKNKMKGQILTREEMSAIAKSKDCAECAGTGERVKYGPTGHYQDGTVCICVSDVLAMQSIRDTAKRRGFTGRIMPIIHTSETEIMKIHEIIAEKTGANVVCYHGAFDYFRPTRWCYMLTMKDGSEALQIVTE